MSDELSELLAARHGFRVDALTRGRLDRSLSARGASPAAVAGSPALLERVLDDITVQETSFFRDPPVWADLADEVLPAALAAAGGDPLVVWSAGCANGQEPWTLAMLLTELGARRFEVVATDVSAAAVRRASAGTYEERELRGLDRARRERFLERSGPTWTVRPALRAHVRFARHNAATDPAPVRDGSCALVLCRYVLIYLTPTASDALLGGIVDALAPRGRLVIGAAESLWHLSERFTPVALPQTVAYRPREAGDAPALRAVSSVPARPRPAAAPAPRRSVPPPAAPAERLAASPVPVRAHAHARGEAAGDAARLVLEGETAAARGDHAAAATAFRGAAFLDPDNALAFAQLGLALEAAGDPGASRAFRSARAAVDRLPAGQLGAELGVYPASALVRLLAEKLA